MSFYPNHFSRHRWSWGDEGGISNKPRSLAFLISAKTSEEALAGTHEKPDGSIIDSPIVTNTRPRVYVFPIQGHRGANRFGGVFARSQESGGNVRGGVERIAVVLNDSTADCMLGDQSSQTQLEECCECREAVADRAPPIVCEDVLGEDLVEVVEVVIVDKDSESRKRCPDLEFFCCMKSAGE